MEAINEIIGVAAMCLLLSGFTVALVMILFMVTILPNLEDGDR